MARDYDTTFRQFDSPLMQQLRQEAYGEDIGQHSWVTADQLRDDLRHLALSRDSRLLDLGCGPAGPLVFIVQATGCRGLGLDLSPEALAAARRRTSDAGLQAQIDFRQADLNQTLPVSDASFDAAISMDTVLHIRDREHLFASVGRLLMPGAQFLFTDAGVLTGPASADELKARSATSESWFVPPALNERLLHQAGFQLNWVEDRTESVVANATGRLRACLKYRAELEQLEGPEAFTRQHDYLQVVMALAARRALSRFAYSAVYRAS